MKRLLESAWANGMLVGIIIGLMLALVMQVMGAILGYRGCE